MNFLKMLGEEVSAWSSISVHPHRFGGKEFLFGSAEVGHVHEGGIIDIPFPRAVRNALLTAGLAEQHHWVPNSGVDYFPRAQRRRPQPRSLADAAFLPALRAEDGERSSRTAGAGKCGTQFEPGVQVSARKVYT